MRADGFWNDLIGSNTRYYIIEWQAGRFSDDDAIDTLNGGDEADTTYGGGGNDVIDAGNHNDQVYGGDGDDITHRAERRRLPPRRRGQRHADRRHGQRHRSMAATGTTPSPAARATTPMRRRPRLGRYDAVKSRPDERRTTMLSGRNVGPDHRGANVEILSADENERHRGNDDALDTASPDVAGSTSSTDDGDD